MADYFPILSFLRVLRSDLESPAIVSGFFVESARLLWQFSTSLIWRLEMSVYKELSIRFQEHRAARHDQRRRLAEQALRLVRALEHYLELPAKVWANPKNGQELSYVRLGTGDQYSFVETSPHELSSLDGVMEFSVSVTLESAPHEFPKVHHIIRLAVGAKAGGYEFVSEDFEGTFLVPSGDDADHIYEGVCTAIVNVLKNGYDVSTVL